MEPTRNGPRRRGNERHFCRRVDDPLPDLEAATKHGWQVAGPDAYPGIFHKERGLSLRPPLAWELELVAGCLRGPTSATELCRTELGWAAGVTLPRYPDSSPGYHHRCGPSGRKEATTGQ